MSAYTYSIFDADPASVSGSEWPAHDRAEIEAADDEEALDEVLSILEIEAAGLSTADGYDVGDVIYAHVWSDDDTPIGDLSYTLTIEDLNPSKSAVDDWETVANYVATFPADEGEGACDVEVQVGYAHGAWFARTTDDAGGSDDAPDTAYATRDEAVTAAEEFAAAHDEGDGEGNAGSTQTSH